MTKLPSDLADQVPNATHEVSELKVEMEGLRLGWIWVNLTPISLSINKLQSTLSQNVAKSGKQN